MGPAEGASDSGDLTCGPAVELEAMTQEQADGPDAPLIGHEEDHQHVPSASSGNLFVWCLTVSAAISGMLFGYDTGVISSTLVSIGSDLSSRPLTTLDKSVITSFTSLFALIASPVAGLLADRIGRRSVIVAADVLFIIGALWQAITTTVWGMILGRSVIGLAIGAASLIVPLYLSELAPGHLRGRMVTVLLLFITGGQVIAYVVGWAFSTMPGGWRWMVGIGAFPAINQAVLLITGIMPETPRYLMKANHESQARHVLSRVYRTTDGSSAREVDHVLQAIRKEIRDEEEARASAKGSSAMCCLPPTLHALLFQAANARALTITCMLQALQQLCGFNSVMYFSATIFDMLQFASPTLTSLSIASTNFIFTVVSFYLIDRVGRRRILLITVPVMIVALLLCGTAFDFVQLPDQTNTGEEVMPGPSSRIPAFAILFSLLLYVAPYATGLGPIPWLQSEMFGLSVRSLGSSLATASNWSCNTIVGLTFLPMLAALTPMWTFTVYAVVCALGWVAIWMIYPETAGLDLEDVSKLLQDGWGTTKDTSTRRRDLS